LSYTYGSTVPFTATFRHADGLLADPTSPQAVITFPDSVTTETVALDRLDEGHYKGSWTVPADVPAGVYTFVYEGTFDGGNWTSDVLQFTVVAEQGYVEPGLSGLVDLADNALTTIARLKMELGLADDDSSQDDHCALLINVASANLESALYRELARAATVETLSGYGLQRINLRRYPIVSIESVTVCGDDVTDFVILAERGQLYRRSGFPLSAGLYRSSSAQTVGGLPFGPPIYDFTADQDPRSADLNVVVTYTGGYVLPKDAAAGSPRTLPWDIEGACLRIAIDMHKRDPGVVSDQAAGGTRFQVSLDLLEQEVRKLRRYRRWA
jgi:hypothetical protein